MNGIINEDTKKGLADLYSITLNDFAKHLVPIMTVSSYLRLLLTFIRTA